MIKKFTSMLYRQIQLNLQVSGEGWYSSNLPWHTAIWTECAELMETTDWKWWKHTKHQPEKFKSELVDIWHFGMSIMMSENEPEQLSAMLVTAYHQPKSYLPDLSKVPRSIEDVAFCALATKTFDFCSFFRIMFHSGVDLDELYRQYFAKVTLNQFRVDNGYKTGQYLWNTTQDNQILAEIMALVPKQLEDVEEFISSRLSRQYDTFKVALNRVHFQTLMVVECPTCHKVYDGVDGQGVSGTTYRICPSCVAPGTAYHSAVEVLQHEN